MPNFIVLTSLNADQKLYINVNKICSIYTIDDKTIVHFDDIDHFYRVKETPEEIMNMIVGIPKVINI